MALGKMNKQGIYYLIAGRGNKHDVLEKLAKENNFNLYLLGYRSDVAELYKIADLYIHPSFREGLPVALMEALACGVPCMASNIRGCRDLLENTYLFNPHDINDIFKHIYNNAYGGTLDIKFDKNNINKILSNIYKK